MTSLLLEAINHDPLFYSGVGIIGSVIIIFLLACIPCSRKRNLNTLEANLDILVHDYKIEVTRAIEVNIKRT